MTDELSQSQRMVRVLRADITELTLERDYWHALWKEEKAENAELRQLIEDSKPRIRKLEEDRNAALNRLYELVSWYEDVKALLEQPREVSDE